MWLLGRSMGAAIRQHAACNLALPLAIPCWLIWRPPAIQQYVPCAPSHMRLPVCTPCAQACGNPAMRSSQTCLHLWSGHAECAVGSPLSRAPWSFQTTYPTFAGIVDLQHGIGQRVAHSLTPGHLTCSNPTQTQHYRQRALSMTKYHRLFEAKEAYVAILRGDNRTRNGVCCSQKTLSERRCSPRSR